MTPETATAADAILNPGSAIGAGRRTTVAVRRAYLIRHGETAWSISGQHTGITDIPLTENGRNVARRLQVILSRETFAMVLSSPLRRAVQTCELAGLGDSAEIDRDLMEWDYGDYEGLTSAQIQAEAPGWMIFRDGCPGGESPEAIGERVDRVIARIHSAGGHIALFAHGHVLRVLTAHWLGLPSSAGRHFLLDTATLSILSFYRGIPAIQRWNARVMA
jgi:probable phosphoglycerate mutase